MKTFRSLLLTIGIIGATLFAAAFLVSFINAGFVERLAAQMLKGQVEKAVRERIEKLDSGFLSQQAAKLARGYAAEAAQIKRELSEGLPERLAAEIAKISDLSCECRKVVERELRGSFEWKLTSAEAAKQRLTALIHVKYMDTAEKLTREYRIFTGTNAAVLALLALAVFVKRKAGLHLVPPAIVLLVAAVVTAYCYLLEQNWWNTIVFSNYVGFWYVGYLSIAFAFLSDIVFNRGRITTEIVNGLLDAVGSAMSAVPC